jgi:hypothetical protein
MELMGQARTHMNTAIAEGLRESGATYTLPPIQDHVGKFEDVEVHMRSHMASMHEAAAVVPTGAALSHEPDLNMNPTAAAAAAETIILASRGADG